MELGRRTSTPRPSASGRASTGMARATRPPPSGSASSASPSGSRSRCSSTASGSSAKVRTHRSSPRRARSSSASRRHPGSSPVAERRLVSVLFADLVGFTTLSESRDAEDTRELLSRYFEQARTVIERYGGTVEKFIGDAVMAVWGAPVAKEDDAERAVRAALDLVAPSPRSATRSARPSSGAGVLTGEAAVTIGARARAWSPATWSTRPRAIQSAAEPGTVLVGESTKRASRGGDRLRGRRPARAEGQGRAGGAVARAARRRRRAGRAALVGPRGAVRRPRPRAAARQGALPRLRGREEGAARLGHRHRRHRQVAAVVGVREVRRRSRRGRLLAPRPLPLLRRGSRLLGARRDGQDALRDRRGRGARLGAREAARDDRGAHPRRGGAPLGRAAPRPPARARGGRAGDQENLFSAWRILFERLAEESPTILVFEDMQWADAGLLDFLEYLLEWSRSHPLFVLVSRPPGARRQATLLGRRASAASPRSTWSRFRRGDGRPAHRARARPARRSARADPRARRGRPALRRRDRADAARPRPARRRRATSTGRPGRSRRSRCRRRSTR